MKQKRKKVLYIDSEPSFLEQQKKELKAKELDIHLYPFDNLEKAFEFMEKQIIKKNNKLHYILLCENIAGDQLYSSLEKFDQLNEFLKKPDIIVLAENNNHSIRNRVMQYPFVSAFIVKPIPTNYIEFLITGQIA
jgi:response regulator RpfG family c-di-GMP phosphodiesterase